MTENALFKAIFDANPDALLLVDANGQIVLANLASTQLLGYSADELCQLTVEALVPISVRCKHAAYRQAYSTAPRPRAMGSEMNLVAQRRDGSEVMVEIALSPLVSDGAHYTVTAIRSIGEYPRVKQALKQARFSDYIARLGRMAVDMRSSSALVDLVPAMAIEALEVEAGAIYLLNESRTQFVVASGVGLMDEDRLGIKISSTPDWIPGYVLASNAPVIVANALDETRFGIWQGYIDAGLKSAMAVPLSDQGRTIGVLVVRASKPNRFGDEDVRFLESMGNLLASMLQRAQAEEALKHAQKLETVGQLTGGIAHDFNNLLTVIQGNLQVLEELPQIKDQAQSQQMIGAALRASLRGAELTKKLLAFSRRQVLQAGRIDIKAMVSSMADMLRRTLDQRIHIELVCQGPCPPCVADPGQLEAALLNISINARDAMPDGGTLTFSCFPGVAVPDSLAESDVAYVAITITDTGLGMPDEVKERAFEPFFTTKEAGRGTGLGLSTVYGFAKQSNGAVTIDSAPGKGTTVTLYLPVDQSATGESLPVDEVQPQSSVPPQLNVLLVEDDSEVQAVVLKFLQSLDCRVTACSSAEEALPKLQATPDFELLLSDISLGPGMQGMELAHQARKLVPALAVILMSGFSSELLDANTDAPEDWELLQKPYGRADLAQAISRVLSLKGG